jgi:hypothetical protein
MKREYSARDPIGGIDRHSAAVFGGGGRLLRKSVSPKRSRR